MKSPKITEVNVNISKASSNQEINPKIFFGLSLSSYSANSLKDIEELIECPSYFEAINKYSTFHNDEKISTISKIFYQAVENATQRIWILDSYLANTKEKNGNMKIEKLLEPLLYNSEKLDTRLYFRDDINKEAKERLQQIINHINDNIREIAISSTATIVQYKFFKDIKFIHDRFAIVDNQLWHFGSDVGCTQPSFHATSYGWNAESLKVSNFFEELWEYGK